MELKKILITRTDHIGDVFLATPVVKALRKKFPSAYISFLTSKYASAVLKDNPDINEILLIEDADILNKLRKEKYDAALVLFPSFQVCRLIFMAKIPVRIGPANKWFVPFFLNKHVFQHRSRVEKHEADYNLALLKQIGVAEEYYPIYFAVSGEANKFAKDWKEKNGIKDGDNFVIIHPGMKGSALNWPMKNYAEIADKMIKELNVKVLFTYGPGEEDLIQKLVCLMEKTPVILKKPLDLDKLGALIKASSLLFCPSTGILHLGVAVGAKVACVFSPILVQSRKRWGPYGEGHIVFEPDVNCPERFKCKKEKCPHYDCMEKITVDNVFNSIRIIYADNKNSG